MSVRLGRCAGVAVAVAAGCPSLAFGQATAGHLGGAGAIEVPVARIILSLLLCVALAVVAVLWLRRRGVAPSWSRFLPTAARERAIEVIETRRISLHCDACVLRHAGREYLLLVQSGHALVLSDRPAEPEETQP